MIAGQGSFVAPIGDAPASAIDVRDIAAVAVRPSPESATRAERVYTHRPGCLTHAQMAATIGDAIGRPVEFGNVNRPKHSRLRSLAPCSAVASRRSDRGLWHYARREAAVVVPAVREVTGSEPRDFSTFARDYAAAFGAGARLIP